VNYESKKEMNIKHNLKALMKSHELTPSKLSRATKIPISTLHGWLNGVDPKSIVQIKSVADYFDISLDELCFGESQKPISNTLKEYGEEINAGVFEVVLRRVRN